MARFILLLPLIIFFSQKIAAQSVHTISLGVGYAQGEYYDLATDNKASLEHSDWDIAFGVYGTTEAGIFINEGAAYGGNKLVLREVPNKTFSDNLQVSDFKNILENPDVTWSTGAFNTPKDPSDWTDYGWGSYNAGNNKVEGTRLYAVELRNGTHKKITIDSLVNGIYYFRYADLDGSNLQQHSVDKSTYPNQTLAYFSLTTNSIRSGEPTGGWDFLFTRYKTYIYKTNPPTNYSVGGILLNKGVEAVLADNIDPATVDITNYTLGSDSLTIIGHDWKNYGFVSGWSIAPNRVYFIKTEANNLYKIEFVDFKGSSSGEATFQKTSLGVWTAIEEPSSDLVVQLGAFPNPATVDLNVTFSLQQAAPQSKVRLVSTLGQVVLEREIDAQAGLNGLVIPTGKLPRGNYFLSLEAQGTIQTTAVVLR